MQQQTKAALYLDFDNVFGGLMALDQEVATRFAETPWDWLVQLESAFLTSGLSRRWLIRRCYMNPSGRVAIGQGERVYFSRFRPYFTRAGFEVVDCPPLTSQGKNAADIRIVLDVMDVVNSSAACDEFVIASGDADFTPLIQRLRANDRWVTVLSTQGTAVPYSAVADRVLDEQDVIALVCGEDEAGEGDVESAIRPLPLDELTESFREIVCLRLAESDGPLLLAQLAGDLRADLGSAVDDTNWFGAETLSKAIRSLQLEDIETESHWVWDAVRHDRPLASVEEMAADIPDVVQRVIAILDMPRLTNEVWPVVFDVLAEYAATHTFNLTEATRWCRDKIRDRGHDVGRGVFSFLVQGTMRGHRPLNSVPPPVASDVADGFLVSLAMRAEPAGLELTVGDMAELASWMGLAGVPEDALQYASTR